jgi:hypothetical protein
MNCEIVEARNCLNFHPGNKSKGVKNLQFFQNSQKINKQKKLINASTKNALFVPEIVAPFNKRMHTY